MLNVILPNLAEDLPRKEIQKRYNYNFPPTQVFKTYQMTESFNCLILSCDMLRI